MLIKVPVLYLCFVSQIILRIRRAKSLAQDHTVSCVLEGCLSPKHILLEQSVPYGSSVSPRLSEILSLVSLALTFDPVIWNNTLFLVTWWMIFWLHVANPLLVEVSTTDFSCLRVPCSGHQVGWQASPLYFLGSPRTWVAQGQLHLLGRIYFAGTWRPSESTLQGAGSSRSTW